jgi:arsenite oxidase small subunit
MNDRPGAARSGSFPRKNFLKFAGAGAAVAAAAGTSAARPAQAAGKPPEHAIANLSELKVGQALTAAYPDPSSPIVVLKIGHRVEGGVGPDGDIVAYSSFCTHQGCGVAYHPERKILACPCHFSSFDPATGGMQIIGQATTNLPQIVLETHGDRLYATGVRGLIWGRQDNYLKPT